MRKAIITSVLCLTVLICTAPVNAGQVDLGLGLGSGPSAGLGSTFGLRAGFQDKFLKIFSGASDNEFTRALMFRTDISYFSWKKDFSGTSLKYRRVPVFVGGRYFIPADLGGASLFADGGLEMSVDESNVGGCAGVAGCTSPTVSDINLGLAAGIGIEAPINEKIKMGVDFRLHLITGDYYTLVGYVGIPISN